MNNTDNMFNGWADDNPSELEAMDRWFDSDVWSNIVYHADKDCEDSLEVMDTVNDLLGSLCWHMKHNSSKTRIDYEIKQFENYTNQFYK